ncbi:79d3e87a-06a9-425a-8ebf-7e366b9582fa [Sclerotinia trifoliorum]|uniref:79d3e87a-06a9-425a-8ebf-7e366b9582fa n=1 Tax=Sclerotinia trifoliorum TaxID=28548 RepID=A0A8H2ZSV4_9HELO|nr:79d3e87a-06a9-425a-8ebf-7e366b9582fa [Sclerotinia trifoliorum]
MAYSNSTSDRMDELRFRSQQTSRNDASMLGLVSPPRNGNRMAQSFQQQESRGGLTRRFTTDSGRVPTIASITHQRSTQETQEYGPSTYHKVQLLEKKKLEYERLREQKRRFEAEMQLLDLQQRREEQELQQMQEDLGRSSNNNNNAGHQSEPTTPPEYRESSSGFPSAFSRPNRYSTSSITSPPGLYNRPGRSGSQLTSPKSGIMQSRLVIDDKLPSKSVPGSRRNSDEDEKEEAVRQDPTSHRSTNALNRYSMPVTKSRNGMHDMLSLDQTNTTRFLFGEDENAAPGSVDKYLNMNATDDKFPILVRRDEYPGLLSASSAALDLALSQSPAPESNANSWNSFARHRPNQQSLPMNSLQPSQQVATSVTQSSSAESPISVRPSYRHSLDLKFFEGPQEGSAQVASPPKHIQATPPKLQSSYSANDVPTVRTGTNGMQSNNNTPNSHAQQHLHNHNASLGRIPPNAMNRLSREMTSGDNGSLREAQNGGYQSIQSALQASAAPFGPALTQGMTQGMSQAQMSPSVTSPTGQQNYSAQVPGFYNNYGMHMMSLGMQNMQLSPPMYPPPNSYNNYNNSMYQHNGGQRDSQARVIQQRRQNDGEAMNRFANLALEQLGGEIYALCKDQHGCRYLQKKLEDRNPEQVHMIWLETNQHVIELMTDPFGNYLCQKLLEYCNDEERTVLIENASHDLVRIALNQHGTRALQKMIEFISTPGQIQTIIGALRFRVVELIQDLNGNHVIQKCLNKLSPTDAQFIFDAVGQHCVDVGTHRHGCCVLQRCIDHASGDQKAWLIRQISNNAYVLVQDPFGNYVVQYILDLNEPIFTEPLVAMFGGRVAQLSKQKFSSNVIEKCLRCAQEPSKDMLIEEMLQPNQLDSLLRDSFANYVIQTALDYANPNMKTRLIEAIRPHLPAIRTTPYGRRIQAKIQGNENRGNTSTGPTTPNDNETGQLANRHQRGMSSASTGTFVSSPGGFPNGIGPTPITNGLPIPAIRSSAQQGSGFPPNDRLASPAVAHPYNYGRAGGQPGAQPGAGSDWF